MPDIKQALDECKEVLGRIFKALKLEYVIDDDPEIDGVVVKEPGKGGFWREHMGFAGINAEAKKGQRPYVGEEYEYIEYGVYTVAYDPGNYHQPPDWWDVEVCVTDHIGEAVEELAMAVLRGLVQMEINFYGEEQYAKEMVGVEEEMERQRKFQEELSEGLAEEEYLREMLCGEEQDVY